MRGGRQSGHFCNRIAAGDRMDLWTDRRLWDRDRIDNNYGTDSACSPEYPAEKADEEAAGNQPGGRSIKGKV